MYAVCLYFNNFFKMLIHFLHNLSSFEKNIKTMRGEELEERKTAISDIFGSWKKELASGKAKEAKVSEI